MKTRRDFDADAAEADLLASLAESPLMQAIDATPEATTRSFTEQAYDLARGLTAITRKQWRAEHQFGDRIRIGLPRGRGVTVRLGDGKLFAGKRELGKLPMTATSVLIALNRGKTIRN